MILKKLFFYIFITLTIFSSRVFAQQNDAGEIVTDTFKISKENIYKLSSLNILPLSEIVKAGNRVLNFEDYSISYSDLQFKLVNPENFIEFTEIIISYKTISTPLKHEYKKRSLIFQFDKKRNDTVRIVEESNAFAVEKIFGSDIQKTGSISRGFTFGTTKDLALSSGLRLNLAGNLSEDIEIVAALTDENVPIQPEGNTEALEELDKVFIQVKHQNAIATFGDYDFEIRQGEFGNISRKLQGFESQFFYKNNNAFAAVAGAKGKFNSVRFNGIEGTQGPYRLFGTENEKDILIIAGSEKVFIDGIEQIRGETNDYVIDYSLAEITFTPKKLITSQSRIYVDFEYSDRKFERSFYSFGASSNIIKDKFKIGINFAREGDNKNSPIDIVLSESDKLLLEQAGDNSLNAVRTGVILAPADSNGIKKGLYSKVDTLINGEIFSIYKYDPNNSLYNVSFSFVGEGNGDYIKIGLGNYRFNGKGNGAYLPILQLPLPESKQTGNFNMEISPLDFIHMKIDLAGSDYDENLFSKINDKNNFGFAGNVNLKIDPQEIKISKNDFGKIGFDYKERLINKNFSSLDRIDEIEFERNYNTQINRQNAKENLREAFLKYSNNKFQFNSLLGNLNRGDFFKSQRYLNEILLQNEKGINFNFKNDYVNSKNLNANSKWNRNYGTVFYMFNKIKPQFNFLQEEKKDRDLSDSLNNSSLRFYEIIPSINFFEIYGLNFSAGYSFRKDDLPLNGNFTNESKSKTQIYQLEYTGKRSFSTDFNLIFRDKNYSKEFKQLGFQDAQTVLVRSQSRFNYFRNSFNGNLFYETSSQRISKLEKVFLRVAQGTGNYRYIGDLNNNGIAEENEFEFTQFDGDFILTNYPGDNFTPVIDVKTFAQWKLRFSEIIGNTNSFLKYFKILSWESYLRAEENSKDKETSKIYLLDFSRFQNDTLTIRGNNLVQQDLHIFENDPSFNLRLRFLQSRSLFQFNTGIERNFINEKTLRIRLKLIEEIGIQTEISGRNENVSAPSNSFRSRMLNTNSILTDLSYRPVNKIEAGFKIQVSKIKDEFPATPNIIDQNIIGFRLSIAFVNEGRLRFEIERNELISSALPNLIPFEITKGYLLGKNYLGRIYFDHKVGQNLQASVFYEARSLSKRKLVNTARAEIKAYF